jgi:ComF family protein
LGPYQGLLKETVYLFKYGGCTSLAKFFGLLLAELYIDEPQYPRDPVLVPVPLSQEKLQARGYNQSELVAAEIGRILNLPVSSALRRVVHTPSQTRLTRQARQEMIKGVFVLTQKLERPDVILVDDILTTGSTAGECTRVLRESGIKAVGVLTIASGIQENINFK